MKTLKIKFTGNFWEYFGTNIGLTFLTIITLGLALWYQMYWNGKYFVEHLEIEM